MEVVQECVMSREREREIEGGTIAVRGLRLLLLKGGICWWFFLLNGALVVVVGADSS